MCVIQYADDPEPEEQVPAGPLYVPARPGGTHLVVRLFRTPLGARTAVGFTSADRLAATLGASQPWIRLSESALRSMTAPLGASLLTLDPTLTAAPVAAAAVTAVATAGDATAGDATAGDATADATPGERRADPAPRTPVAPQAPGTTARTA
ncbi:SAV_915 family protein [Streptomyces sp. NPDC059917]|uniref:SAV_915 family protein n=1 Tax=Streptomyces sp. NPDC059917 TaxID=3347002 RepID=UPI0036624AEC